MAASAWLRLAGGWCGRPVAISPRQAEADQAPRVKVVQLGPDGSGGDQPTSAALSAGTLDQGAIGRFRDKVDHLQVAHIREFDRVEDIEKFL